VRGQAILCPAACATGETFTAGWWDTAIAITGVRAAWDWGALAYADETDAKMSARPTAIPAATVSRIEPVRRLPER